MAARSISQRLTRKVALITGAGNPDGFGAAIGRRFVAEGAKVLLCDMNRAGVEKVAESMSKDGSALGLELNVTKSADWQKAVEECRSKFGQVDILVNNAGTSYKNKPTAEVTEDEYQRCFDVNVKSLFLSVGVVVPEMKKSGGGCIINVSSIGSVRPRPGLVWYNASKAAVTNATKALAAEYGPDQIRVNALAPLLSGTQLFESFVGVPNTPENVTKFVKDVPLGRLTNIEDVAAYAAFLASEEGAFITGQNCVIDGGKGI